jgi:RecG-like helicase
MRFLPRPVQRPGVPIWVAGYYGNSKPLRRAARYQGFVPVGLEHPDQLAEIVADLTALPGVGPKVAALMEKACGGGRIKDLLFTPPAGLIDRTRRVAIADAAADGIVTVEAVVDQHQPPAGLKQPWKVRMRDETGFLTLVFFHAKPDYLLKVLPEGQARVISGKAERFGSEIQMVHPDLIAAPGEIKEADLLQPVYPLTAGLSANVVRKAIKAALPRLPDLPEWIAGEDFGRGHECCLITVVDRHQHGSDGNNGFSRAHISLHQAMHLAAGKKICFYFSQC